MQMIEKLAAGFPKGVVPGTAEAARYISSHVLKGARPSSRLRNIALSAGGGAGVGLGTYAGLSAMAKRKKKKEQEKKASDGLAKARYAAKHYAAKGQPEKAKSIIESVSRASGKQVKLKKGGMVY